VLCRHRQSFLRDRQRPLRKARRTTVGPLIWAWVVRHHRAPDDDWCAFKRGHERRTQAFRLDGKAWGASAATLYLPPLLNADRPSGESESKAIRGRLRCTVLCHKNNTKSFDHRQELSLATPVIESHRKDLLAFRANKDDSETTRLIRRSEISAHPYLRGALAQLSGKFADRFSGAISAPFFLSIAAVILAPMLSAAGRSGSASRRA
jgi:hypothetical protein